jgi:hypothetical protein
MSPVTRLRLGGGPPDPGSHHAGGYASGGGHRDSGLVRGVGADGASGGGRMVEAVGPHRRRRGPWGRGRRAR